METGTLQKTRTTRLISYLPAYTALWFLCVLIICLEFRVNGKTFIWETDGVPQHFLSFNYLCDYLRDLIVSRHFRGFFDFTLGQGLDILTTLDSYDFTDPVSVLAALVFPLSRMQRYTLMIFIKFYLVGISFLLYCCATEQENRLAVLAGALAYTFSGAVLYNFARHPNYANWSYFFPFLLAGAELYARRGKRAPFAVFVFLNAVTSFYTFYMNAVLTALYVLAGSICRIAGSREKRAALKAEGISVLRLVGVGMIGVLLAACVLLPTVHAFLENYRVGVATGYTASLLHYEWKYYFKLPEALFAANYQPGYSTAIGMNMAVFIPAVLLFLRKGDHAQLKSLLVLSLLMLCVPLAGRVLNGFGYATNRWSYALPFYAAVALVRMFDAVQTTTAREKIMVFLAAAAYLVICLAAYALHSDSVTRGSVRRLIIAFFLVTFLFWLVLRSRPGLQMERSLFSLVVLCAAYQCFATFSASAGFYVGEFLDSSRASAVYSDFSAVAAKGLGDGFFRVETEEQEEEDKENLPGYHGLNGTSFYWSLFPAHVYDYYRELGLSTVAQNCRLAGLSGRTGLLELAGVRYYTRPASSTGLVPYGYHAVPSPDTGFEIYENEFALPIGYTLSGYITREEYDALDEIGKEQALLQAAVLESPVGSASVGKTEIARRAQSLDFELESSQGVSWEGSDLTAANGGTITLTVDIPEDCEVYLTLRKIRLVGTIPRVVPKQGYIVSIAAGREAGDGYAVKKLAYVANTDHRWPVLRDNVVYNLGYGHAGENRITLEFSRDADLSLAGIEVTAVPMSSYREHARALGEVVLESPEVGVDRVTGSISAPEERILQFSIPYSDGWTAYVDGEKTETFRSDVMYLAVMIPSGEHQVELRYETPWLRAGVMLSCATLVLWIAFEALKRRTAGSG